MILMSVLTKLNEMITTDDVIAACICCLIYVHASTATVRRCVMVG